MLKKMSKYSALRAAVKFAFRQGGVEFEHTQNKFGNAYHNGSRIADEVYSAEQNALILAYYTALCDNGLVDIEG